MPTSTLPIAFKKLLLVIFTITLCSCGKRNSIATKYTSAQDTLIVSTQKHKGPGLFAIGSRTVEFENNPDVYDYHLQLPKNMDSIQKTRLAIDFKAKPLEYIDIISGYINHKNVFIVDANHNKDLTDDEVHLWKAMEWDNPKDLAACNFKISDGKQMVDGYSWLNMGIYNSEYKIGKSEYLTAKVTIDNDAFTLGFAEPRNFSSFYCQGFDTVAALLVNGMVKKDSLTENDIVYKNEYFNLNGKYYRFAGITNNGDKITLIRENNFNTKLGSQIGMLAPAFTCVTTKGDTINSSSAQNSFKIIANSCGCGGDTASDKASDAITDLYKDKAFVLHLDSGKGDSNSNRSVDTQQTFNKDLYNSFRGQYCSRICYVIDKNNRIIDKFDVTDWKNHLPKLFGSFGK